METTNINLAILGIDVAKKTFNVVRRRTKRKNTNNSPTLTQVLPS